MIEEKVVCEYYPLGNHIRPGEWKIVYSKETRHIQWTIQDVTENQNYKYFRDRSYLDSGILEHTYTEENNTIYFDSSTQLLIREIEYLGIVTQDGAPVSSTFMVAILALPLIRKCT